MWAATSGTVPSDWLFVGASLAPFGIILAKVFDERFPANRRGVTTLPVVGVSNCSTMAPFLASDASTLATSLDLDLEEKIEEL